MDERKVGAVRSAQGREHDAVRGEVLRIGRGLLQRDNERVTGGGTHDLKPFGLPRLGQRPSPQAHEVAVDEHGRVPGLERQP